jgi:radical SAM protein with 4Fe4S-binding SPASM domain
MHKILNASNSDYLDLRSPCGAAIGQLAYTPRGEIFSCDEARTINENLFMLGNVKNDNYKKILGSRKTCSLVASSINDCQICDYCVYKPFCGICPVCNFVEQGSVIGKIIETPRCKIYKAQFTYIFEKLKDPDNKKIFLDWIGKKDGEK